MEVGAVWITTGFFGSRRPWITLSWGTLHPSLVASTILSQRAGSGTFCWVCQGCDHSSAECALLALQPPAQQGVPARVPRTSQVCLTRNEGRCAFLPGQCVRLHTCATCGSSSHPARDCRETPADSRFHTARRGRVPPSPSARPTSH